MLRHRQPDRHVAEEGDPRRGVGGEPEQEHQDHESPFGVAHGVPEDDRIPGGSGARRRPPVPRPPSTGSGGGCGRADAVPGPRWRWRSLRRGAPRGGRRARRDRRTHRGSTPSAGACSIGARRRRCRCRRRERPTQPPRSAPTTAAVAARSWATSPERWGSGVAGGEVESDDSRRGVVDHHVTAVELAVGDPCPVEQPDLLPHRVEEAVGDRARIAVEQHGAESLRSTASSASAPLVPLIDPRRVDPLVACEGST